MRARLRGFCQRGPMSFIVREGLSLEAARDAVKQARPCVPYMRALEAYLGERA